VLGLDPDPSELWPVRGREDDERCGDAVCAAVVAHCRALLEATAQACVAVKLQLARFEALGPAGAYALRSVADDARGHGLLVIADGKRGDIAVSAAAYASAMFGGIETPFGGVAGLRADLVTVNPLMGRDAIEPFVTAARASGGGVLVLVRTSNPGAAEVQDLRLAGGEAVWERLAAIVAELGAEAIGGNGLSDVGAVLGATARDHLARARALMPAAPFLLPGVGAQGGRVEDLAAAFLPGPAGGLISASRSVAGAYRQSGRDPAAAARAEAERLRDTAWALSRRVAVS
jgi:orotidine-5'-phosphate decarboxylase